MDKGALKIKRVVKRRLWSGANPNMVVDSFWVPRGHAQITQGFSNTSLVFWNASKKCGGKLSRAIESRSVTGVRAGHGQGAGRATAVEADGEGCPNALERYVRAACVSPPVHESSHGKCSLTPAVHRLSGCATHSKAMALSLPIDKLVWLCWSRASAARQASAPGAL